ncbi:acid protease [Pluteus cervinus]|uniref:Acid protease n=1 Tax=Pluteus cervinus TaxID=181527 RepID=A0ACD3AZH3_9AGAR|nr:acid protease [Pluteus cervinus]
MHSLIPLSLLLFLPLQSYAFGVHFEVRVTHPSGNHARLSKRANATIPISNTGNAQYVANITLGGVQLPVLLDTGSSDLWVHFPGTPPSTKDTGKATTLAYAVGKAHGDINTAVLQFDNYTVQDQAFLMVTDTSTFTTDLSTQGFSGLLGLGPNEGSVIRDQIDSSAGDSMLTRIFSEDLTSQNYISFLLDRKGDPGDAFTGQFTISQLVPGFENITSMPKLDVKEVNLLLNANQHWQALTDKSNGLVGPDGQQITVPSLVLKAPKGQFVAVFDSGFTFSQVPRAVSDQIYGRVKGAIYDSTNEWWTVPCGQYLNISFSFGGQIYPIHPLDTVDDNFNQFDATGNKVCIGTFQPITSAFSMFGQYDMILGMSFLRNTYTLLDFGNWIDGSSSNQDNPYIQLASVTSSSSARDDFIKVRLGGVDTTSDPQWQLLPSSQMQHSPISAAEKKKMYQEAVLSKWPYILAGCLIIVLGSVGWCVWRCCCRGKRRGSKKNKNKGMFTQEPESEAYLPLEEPHHRVGSHSSLALGQGMNSPYSMAAPPSVHHSQHPSYGSGGGGPGYRGY